MINPINVGIILSNRYRIMQELGHGGFGRTYLAEDIYRFNELCVLKEFAPQVQGSYALQKAQELFEREAGVLYKLQHSQIPSFRELFHVILNDQGYIFLVQDYVNGKNYRELLEERKRQGLLFSEQECKMLLIKLLPVIDYIHSLGVIHRDISPDNLILRTADQLPVLIDFGGVKQVAATVESQYGQQNGASIAATRLGKVGYAPDEQMQMGIVFPHSDLYALAATVLVLLTGKEPQQLIDGYTLTWNWRSHCSLSGNFGEILDKMLAYRPGDRYQVAGEVLQVLQNPIAPNLQIPATIPPPEFNTQPVPPISPLPVTQTPNKFAPLLSVMLVLIVMVGMGGVGWFAGNYWLKNFSSSNSKKIEQGKPSEQEKQDALRDRLQKLSIDGNFFVKLVDEIFYAKYPELGGKALTKEPADRDWRDRWYQVANNLLNRLENISEESRKRLGNYDISDINRWKVEVNKLNLSSRALYDLADAEFFYLFPDQPRDLNLIDLEIGQIWQAITTDKLKALQTGEKLETIKFSAKSSSKKVSEKLQPGEGKAYIARLKKGQTLQLSLDNQGKETWLSIYTPGNTQKSKALLEDSPKVNFSAQLDDTGYYEFIVVSRATSPIAYELTLNIE
ncbi:serine/threonine protein kinase [Oscillatoriales cyanobacterium USR001]|nr:serine/threonine protein kinase [Oscillatoriales cyanobacterium USR001]